MNKETVQDAMKEINDVLAIVRQTNDKTVKMLGVLTVIDLNLRVNAQSLERQIDRDVITEFSLQIQREIATMKSMMNEMLKNRPRLIEAVNSIEEELNSEV